MLGGDCWLMPSDRARDTDGAGDVVHGAHIHSYLADPTQSWKERFRIARAAAAYEIQHLGKEAVLPTLADIAETRRELGGDELISRSPGPARVSDGEDMTTCGCHPNVVAGRSGRRLPPGPALSRPRRTPNPPSPHRRS